MLKIIRLVIFLFSKKDFLVAKMSQLCSRIATIGRNLWLHNTPRLAGAVEPLLPRYYYSPLSFSRVQTATLVRIPCSPGGLHTEEFRPSRSYISYHKYFFSKLLPTPLPLSRFSTAFHLVRPSILPFVTSISFFLGALVLIGTLRTPACNVAGGFVQVCFLFLLLGAMFV